MILPTISPNLLVIAVMVGGLLLGAIGGKHRLKLLILSIYVGIVLASQLSAIAVKQLHQPVELVTLILFALPILLFGFGRAGKHENSGSAIPNAIVGLAAGGLIAASALSLIPPSEAKNLTDNSLVASLLLQYQLWLLALLPLIAWLFTFKKSKEKKH